MGPDGMLFIFCLLDEASLLFLAVYFVSFRSPMDLWDDESATVRCLVFFFCHFDDFAHVIGTKRQLCRLIIYRVRRQRRLDRSRLDRLHDMFVASEKQSSTASIFN